MADICVIYLSEDESIAGKLVELLKKHWDVWWADDIAHGDWEEAVRSEIDKSSAIVAVLSQHAKGKRKTIIKDEMRYAEKSGKKIFPFLIGPADVPFGFGDLHHTEAHGWHGEENDIGFMQLKGKIAATIGNGKNSLNGLTRPQELIVRGKILRLPAFVFSLSSHETQVTPTEGAPLLHYLESGAMLISAYDAWKCKRDSNLNTIIKKLRNSTDVVFLDSGNYEANRKNDLYAKQKRPQGWKKEYYWETTARLSPDIAFSFDTVNPKGEPERIAERIAANFWADDRALPKKDYILCPIIHLPKDHKESRAECAAQIVSSVASKLDPVMLAIPERELGDGLLERVKTVRDIRKALDALGKYYPLHLLGTGNPISMIALAAAGADSFDGLEWCRTVADYDKGFLFHFQQFPFFSKARLHQIQDPRIRLHVEDEKVTYSAKTLMFNIDFFKDWTRTMQSMIHSGQTEILLKMVPNIGSEIFKELSK
jgi:queuine/archaeosine tRNA-ribosyltransferase